MKMIKIRVLDLKKLTVHQHSYLNKEVRESALDGQLIYLITNMHFNYILIHIYYIMLIQLIIEISQQHSYQMLKNLNIIMFY